LFVKIFNVEINQKFSWIKRAMIILRYQLNTSLIIIPNILDIHRLNILLQAYELNS